jgi:microcystin-dependent protein
MRQSLILIALVLLGLLAAPAQAQTDPFVGQVEIVAFNFAPNGWALCNGQLLSISQNTALFALLGTQYGGDGITTFALPDLRGRMAIHFGQGLGLQNYDIGEAGGEEQVTLTLNEIPAHTHHAMASSLAADQAAVGGNVWGTSAVFLYSSGSPTSPMNSLAIGSVGAGLPHDNLPPFLVMNFIIALQGIFPSRG